MKSKHKSKRAKNNALTDCAYPLVFIGAGNKNRTRDLLITNHKKIEPFDFNVNRIHVYLTEFSAICYQWLSMSIMLAQHQK